MTSTPTAWAAAAALLLSCWSASSAEEVARDPAVVEKQGSLADVCEANSGPTSDCKIWLEISGDHAYVMPTEAWKEVCIAPPRREIWEPSEQIALSKHHLFWEIVPGEPHNLPADVLQAWISADTPLADDAVETITFCGYAIHSVFLLDWSAITARLRFDLVQVRQAENLPLGTVASRGVFENGLTISRSVIKNDLHIQDAIFGSYLELEENKIESSVSIKNSRLAGAARIRNNFFEGRLRIEGVEIAGDTLISRNSFPSTVIEPERNADLGNLAKDPALDAEFDGSSRSVVRLRETRLGGILNINENNFRKTDENAQRSLYIQKSIISDNDLTIFDNAFAGSVFITEVEAKRLTISSNKFDTFLSVSASLLYSARTYNNRFSGPLKISSNDIQSMLNIDRDILVDNTGFLEIRANDVGREISFAPSSWPKTGISVDLSFNVTQGSFNIFWPIVNRNTGQTLDCGDFDDERGEWKNTEPDRWNGELAFVGSSVRGSLWLAESCALAGAPMQPLTGARALDGDDWRPRQAADSGESNASAMNATYSSVNRCDASAYFMLDFKEVETGFLRLSLPPDDPYCWRGKGLGFQYFGSPIQGVRLAVATEIQEESELLASIEDDEIRDLYLWLGRLEDEDPEVYFAAADYLRDRGYLDKSREWLEEGRRVDFGFENCSGIFACTAAIVRTVYFLPSGFNTSPERAALCVLVLWILMTFVYWQYHKMSSAQRNAAGAVQTVVGPATEMSDRDTGAGSDRREPKDYDTRIDGFVAHEPEYENRSFSLFGYSLDVTLPVVSLGLYRTFVPTSGVVRGITVVHHIVGFWFVTVFLSASFF